MRIKSLFFGLLFMMISIAVHGQIQEVYYQGFESTETVRFKVTPTANASYATDLVSSGTYSLKLTQSATQDIEVLSDTIDLSSSSSVLSYIALEFDHINNIKVNGAVPDIAKIFVRRVDQTNWTQLTQVQYNKTSTYSTAFVSTGTFNENSYIEWKRNTMTNEYWRSERFDLNNLISSSVSVGNRKLLVKLELKKRTIAADAAEAWWIDNLRVRASNNAMVKPKISMARYPDGGAYPNSRYANIMLDATTTVAQGICNDSVNLYYKVGSDPAITKLIMSPVSGVVGRYQAIIPFFGYDTLMQFYCVAKDATTNHNEVTFPAAANSWIKFWYTRGVDQPGILTQGFTGTTSSNLFPFQSFSDGRSEWVFDSTLMANAGYGPGAITDLRFTVQTAVTAEQSRPYFQFRMKNAPASYVVPSGQATIYFSTDMQIVYDSTLIVPVTAQDGSFTIHLKDTFYYAGSDLVMQALYDGTVDPPATNLKMITSETSKQSFYKYDMGSGMGTSPYTDPSFRWTDAAYVQNKRPAIVMTQHKNQPLLYDMGISKLEFPTYEMPIMEQPSHLDVTLRNYGALPVNSIRISYTIDDTIFGYYDWTGTMNGGDSASVTVTNNLVLPAGFHYVRVWVQDTLTASGVDYRDHEPFNDTAYTSFIVCSGPLNGEKTIGVSATADYNTIEEFLFSLSRCGIDDSLIVKIEGGSWPAFTMPDVDGISADNYIVFETTGSHRATIYADSTTADDYIVNLNSLPYIRFRNINFERRSDTLSTMIGLAPTSNGCHFEGCHFIDLVENPSVAIRIPALLTNNNADSIVVNGCSFEGGVIGVSLIGQSINERSGDNVLRNSIFRDQINNAVSARYQTNLIIDHNEMYDVVDNQSNVMQVLDCDGDIDITANKVYTTHGAGCIGVSGVVGTSTNHAIIANNMFVSADDGTANLLRTPVNIISADWTDVVYNSVKLTAQTRNNTASVNFGGGNISNCRFVNNIVACMDSKNYALNYTPGTATSNTVSHNVYYSKGVTLNKLSGVSYNNVETWSVAVPQDTTSIKTDPIYLNGSKVDLRTFKRIIKGVGMPLAEVTIDMFDTVRNDTATCPGAFEFSALLFDFEPEALVSPETDNCAMPENVQLSVRIRNNGMNQLTVGGNDILQLAYSVNGGSVNLINVPIVIPAEDTVTFNTGVYLHMPSDSIFDATYSIRLWTIFPGDPNQTNDTSDFTIISRFHSEAPSDTTKYVNYLTEATVTVLNGIEQWKVYDNDEAPMEPSTIYWYYNSDDAEPFLEGPTLTTDTLRSDTVFYIRQHRKLPIVRMTQLMVKTDSSQGIGTLPEWMNSQTQFAVQITNIGDAPASLLGDTLRTISPSSGYNNRLCKFGDITLQPGQSIVVQYISGTASALYADKTVHAGVKIAPQMSSDLGVVYRHNGKVIDAVALNSVITAPTTQGVKWSTQNVPSHVWSGSGVAPSTTNGGLVRVAFNGDASDWIFATSAKPLHMSTTDPSWIKYVDNECPGDVATVSLIIANPPTNDIHLSSVELPSGCDLGEQNLSVGVRNYGDSTVHNLELSYLFGGDTITDTLTFPIVGHSDTVYTFAEPVNLHFANDSVVKIKIWSTQIEGDPVRWNDTTTVTTTSLFTLDAPIVVSPDTCEYATSDTLTVVTPPNALPIWYDYNMNPVDTSMTHITEQLYSDGVLGVSYLVAIPASGQIGTGVTKIGKTSYPSPYQPNNRFVKQQFIYTANELRQLGLGRGFINRIAFHLDSIYGTVDSLVFDKYVISMGACTDSVFATNSDWHQANVVVFDKDSMVINRSQSNDWVWHDFDRQFNWDGESNIVVQIVFEDSVRYTTGVQTSYTNKINSTIYKAANEVLAPTTADFVGTGTKGTSRPNVKFEGAKYGCSGPISQIEVNVTNVPAIDGSVSWPAGFDTISYNTCANISPLINVRNLGSGTIDSFNLIYSIDGSADLDTTPVNTAILSGSTLTVPLFNRELAPGHHSLSVVVNIDGDNITSNDSIKGKIIVRFCNGTYTIGQDSVADFHTFKAAVDTLNAVGIVGPVAFNVAAGEYNERVELHTVYGSSETNTITFSGPADSTVAKLIGNTNSDSNYVFYLDSVSNVTIENISMASKTTATAKNANVLVMNYGSNITIRNNSFKAPGHIYNSEASCIVMNGILSNVLVEGNRTDSGYYAIVHLNIEDQNCTNLTINNNSLIDFQSRGIELQGITNAVVRQNLIHAGAAAENRGMIGVNMSNVNGIVSIEKNKIYLVDEYKGSKRGIHLLDVSGTNENRVLVANNMSSVSGTGKTGLTPVHPSGIYIDGTSSYINIFYNSVRVYAGLTQNDTRAFFAGASATNLQVVNNIFANFSKSYTYYVTTASSVTLSNNNGYYTGGAKFAFWGADRASLTALQTANGQDQNSVLEEPYYTAVDDLHLLMTNYCAKGQSRPEVTDDIDGRPRAIVGGSTLGAHEMTILNHNMTIVRIIEPVVPKTPADIESDSVKVLVQFYNNSPSVENNVSWYAYIDGHKEQTMSEIRNIGPFTATQLKTDSVMMPTVLGIIDTQIVRVVLMSEVDDDTTDNQLTAKLYLTPAYNVRAVKISATGSGCSLTSAPITINVKNVGSKDIPAGTQLRIGYRTQAYFPSYISSNPDSNKVTIPTMPTIVEETRTLDADLVKNGSKTFTFTDNANLYPTGMSENIKVRLNGWVKLEYDIINDNDTTDNSTSASPIVDAYYTPAAPVGNDTTLPYGTWGEVTASQENMRPIRWYRDTSAAPFYSTSGANAYEKSCKWSNTPAYFHDSVYYLRCYSDKNCPSKFSQVHVQVRQKYANDMALEEVLAPLGRRVYMENDTVRVRIANYGTSAKNNIPVTYQLRKGNNTNPIQEVTEICTTNIGAGQTYEYTFSTLLTLDQPTMGGTYQLRAWTDLETDQSRRNDTIRLKQQMRPAEDNNTLLDYTFNRLPESTYPSRSNAKSEAINITRFTFNDIDLDIPPLGRSYINFGVFDNPDWPVLHLQRGTVDTAFINIADPTDPGALKRGKVAVYIDFNRNGSFSDSTDRVVFADNLWSNSTLIAPITIPHEASLGYMKMRVVSSNFDVTPSPNLGAENGMVMDFLLFIDGNLPNHDLAINYIVSPRGFEVNGDTTVVTFSISNQGMQAIDSVEFNYLFNDEDPGPNDMGTFVWHGPLQPGASAVVSLPKHVFPFGTTHLVISHNMSGDADTSNNQLDYEYHRLHIITLTMDDNFDSPINYLYAPIGYNAYTHNYWQKGTPNKTKISGACSAPNAWVTDLNQTIKTGRRGNISYLYLPIINITSIKSDTMSFDLSRNLTNGSACYLEYYSFENKWERVQSDLATGNWYNDTQEKVFNGTSTGYVHYYFRTSNISGNFQEKCRFRVVYTTPMGTNDNSSYGEGCAIDNFHIGRARARKDVGVIEIIKPDHPSYGQTIIPEVAVRNYGSDTIFNLAIGYTDPSNPLPSVSTFSCVLPPDGVDTFQMQHPFTIYADYPDTINVAAFTIMSADLYWDNDTTRKVIPISHLNFDISAKEVLRPLDRVIAGDSVTVEVRIENFGNNAIPRAYLSYFVNNGTPVNETVDFNTILGRPLDPGEFFNYTFEHRYRASMGIMKLVAIAKDDSNSYVYNDTIVKYFRGISSIMDLSAVAAVIDNKTNSNSVSVQVVIENRGARGANDFEVGFFIDGDSGNPHTEICHLHHPLAALSTGYYLFEYKLPYRATPYDNITAWVSIPEDNDVSNDTTNVIMPATIDLELVRIIVEENAEPDCHVYLEVRNVGNMAVNGKTIFMNANINSSPISYSEPRRINPNQTVLMMFNRRIPKDINRHYVGSATITVQVDTNEVNNQTTKISVVNFVENAPTIEVSDMDLGQNYPNPFSTVTEVPITLNKAVRVRFFIIDNLGHLIENREFHGEEGINTVTVDMAGRSSGIYYYGIEVNGQRKMRKMILR